jgi:hypothetical protein
MGAAWEYALGRITAAVMTAVAVAMVVTLVV